MKVLEKAENVCLASMLTPHLTERKYFNLRGFEPCFVLIRGSRNAEPAAKRSDPTAEPGAKRSGATGSTLNITQRLCSSVLLVCAFNVTRSLRCASLPVLLGGRSAPFGFARHFRITRLSPARRVTRSRSKYSNNGIAYFREMPARSLKVGTSINRSGSCDAA